MLSAGWIEEVQDGATGRARPVMLTDAGKKLIHRAEPAWRAAQVQAQKILGTDGVSTVTGIANGILKSEPVS